MKIFVLFFLFFLLTMAIAMIMDLMMGMKFSISLRNLRNPFWVMTIPEYIIIFGLLSLMFFPPMFSIYKQRKRTQTREKS